MDNSTMFLIGFSLIACLVISVFGLIEVDKHYKNNLASLGYKLECHYIEVDGVRSNWCELVSIKKK